MWRCLFLGPSLSVVAGTGGDDVLVDLLGPACEDVLVAVGGGWGEDGRGGAHESYSRISSRGLGG